MVDKGIKKKFTSKAPPSNSATSIGGNPTTATPNRKAPKKNSK